MCSEWKFGPAFTCAAQMKLLPGATSFSDALMVIGYLMFPSSSFGIACLSTFRPVGSEAPGSGGLSCRFFLESGQPRLLILSSCARKKAQT